MNHCNGLKLLILPAATASPKGMENSNVSKNISIEVPIPHNNSSKILLNNIRNSPKMKIKKIFRLNKQINHLNNQYLNLLNLNKSFNNPLNNLFKFKKFQFKALKKNKKSLYIINMHKLRINLLIW